MGGDVAFGREDAERSGSFPLLLLACLWKESLQLRNRSGIFSDALHGHSGQLYIRAFSSGGERFPDTEEVRSSNLLTPTINSQLRGIVSELLSFCPQMVHAVGPQTSPGNRRVFPPTGPSRSRHMVESLPRRAEPCGRVTVAARTAPWWRFCRTCQKLADGLREVIGNLYSPRKIRARDRRANP